MGIVFDQANTWTHSLYEQFKEARTVAEALELAATEDHIRYEYVEAGHG